MDSKQMKHTPGPWRIMRAVDYTGDTESRYNPILSIESADGKTVYYTDSGYFQPNEADARLIAAAPDLLEALEGLYEQCAMMHKHWGEGSNQKQADAAIASGLAAIARAKGE